MKKISSILFLFIIISHCSLDNKTGIWKEKENIANKDQNLKLEDVLLNQKYLIKKLYYVEI